MDDRPAGMIKTMKIFESEPGKESSKLLEGTSLEDPYDNYASALKAGIKLYDDGGSIDI